MKPLDPLGRPDRDAGLTEPSSVERALRESSPADVRAELGRLDALTLSGASAAARTYAHGALAMREGRLDDAHDALTRATDAFADSGEPEAEALARAEAWLAAIRRGPRSVYADAIDALEAIAFAPGASRTVYVVATHYKATALRYAGRAEATLGVLLDAFGASDDLLVERAQVLNSLGTLYVVLGANGAARSVLEHAAELNHQIGDRVSEAISYGQLGSAAVAQGLPEVAKKYLQKQEWLASRVGDVFGRARALVLLADLAIDLGRPDDAVELAGQARALASSVTPPLGMWVAYATRTIGRAKVEMEDPDADGELDQAEEQFRRMGNRLGEAMVSWDRAHKDAREGGRRGRSAWRASAWSFATLGLTARVAQVLADLRAHTSDSAELRALDLALAAAAQCYPHLGDAQEVELVLSKPDVVAEVATRRLAGLRNLGRLAAQTLSVPGLFVAAIAAGSIGVGARAIPPPRSAATLLGQLPGVALWAWSPDTSAVELARDLSALRVALGDDARAVLAWLEDARIAAAPFAGELGVELVGAAPALLVARALADPPATLRIEAGVSWDGEAEALARMGGFETVS